MNLLDNINQARWENIYQFKDFIGDDCSAWEKNNQQLICASNT